MAAAPAKTSMRPARGVDAPLQLSIWKWKNSERARADTSRRAEVHRGRRRSSAAAQSVGEEEEGHGTVVSNVSAAL